MDNITNNWLKLLDPINTRKHLMEISVLITAFEFLKESIVDNIFELYCCSKNENGKYIQNDDYKREVLSLDENKNVFQASINWLVKNGVIDENEKEEINKIKSYRNDITHESIKYLSDSNKEIQTRYLNTIYQLMEKIEKWWFFEVELAINPDLNPEDYSDVDYAMPMRLFVLHLLITVATDFEKSDILYEKFKELSNEKNT